MEYRPNILIADGAEAITNGFMAAFDYKSITEFIRIMCWAHVHRNCKSKALTITNKKYSLNIIEDIENLQIMPSNLFFDFALNLFREKWSKVPEVEIFYKHFMSEWVDSTNYGWYEGIADNIPSTDNGLEATNNVVKGSHTLRVRMSVSQYLLNSTDMIRNWSKDRISEKPFHEKPNVDSRMYRLAWDFLYKSTPVIKKSNQIYVLTKDEHKSLINPQIAKSNLDQLQISFDHFILTVKKIKIINLNRTNWTDSKCSCSWFLKNYFCFHLIALAVNEKLTDIPLDYKNVPIEAKPKRGRKPKAKSALIRE